MVTVDEISVFPRNPIDAKPMPMKKRSQALRIYCGLNQDIVAGSQEEKCWLKYDTYTLEKVRRSLDTKRESHLPPTEVRQH